MAVEDGARFHMYLGLYGSSNEIINGKSVLYVVTVDQDDEKDRVSVPYVCLCTLSNVVAKYDCYVTAVC